MDQDEILAVFGIDLGDASQGVRFQRALASVVSAGLALCHFPPNHVPKLSPRLDDWTTVAYLIATGFIRDYGYYMSPQHWFHVPAVRHAIYHMALNSGDLGFDTKEWLDHITERYPTYYELSIVADWIGTKCELCWWEVDACGTQVTEAQWIFLMPRQKQSHHDFISSGGGDLTMVSYDGSSLCVSEPKVGTLASLVVDEGERMVKVTELDWRTMVLLCRDARPA